MQCTESVLSSFFYSCLWEIGLNTMSYVSSVIASGPKRLILDSLYFVTESIYTKNTYSIISQILQSPLCKD